MCDSCLAQDGKHVAGEFNYRNFGESAAWPLTKIDHATYVHLDVGSLSPWAKVDGWRLETTSWDLMHLLFLGTARDIVASSIRCMIDCGAYAAGNIDDTLDDIHREMHATCAAHGSEWTKTDSIKGDLFPKSIPKGSNWSFENTRYR